MKIEDSKGKVISTMKDWENLYKTPKLSHQWKKDRSAHTTAEFMLLRKGEASLQSRLSDVLSLPVKLDRAIVEYEKRFDSYGKGRVHDLGIFGTAGGKNLFVGIEAKVDEPFSESVLDAYLEGIVKQIDTPPTNVPKRIEQLLEMHFMPKPDVSMFDVRYQLLYGTAGTLAADADVYVFYIVVFKTPLYDEVKGAENYRDYIYFINKAGGKPIKLSNKEAIAHELTINGKRLVCIYEYFDW